MKRFIKLYSYAKAYQMKRPFRYALWRWWKGDDFFPLDKIFQFQKNYGMNAEQFNKAVNKK